RRAGRRTLRQRIQIMPADNAPRPTTDATVLARCGRCGQAIRLPAGLTGQIASCPECAASVRTPVVEDAGVVPVAVDVSDGPERLLMYGCERCDSVLESPLRLGGEIGRCPTCG